MDIVIANGFAMESCAFFSREYHCCVLHNTRCKCEDYNPRNSNPTPCKKDCYWYREEEDMNARIPYCLCTNQFPLERCEKNCEDYHSRSKRTQGDKIRSMNDRQIAELLTDVAMKSAEKLCESLKTVDIDLSNCNFNILYKTHLDWLRQEVEEGE